MIRIFINIENKIIISDNKTGEVTSLEPNGLKFQDTKERIFNVLKTHFKLTDEEIIECLALNLVYGLRAELS